MPSAAQDEAKEAILKAITAMAEDAENYAGSIRVDMVRDAAYAWRAIVGGTQPGSVVVKSD